MIVDPVLADHLRVLGKLSVAGEQRVEDHIAVIADDVGGGPERVEHAQIGLRNKAQRLHLRGPCPEPVTGERCRPYPDGEFATSRSTSHSGPPPFQTVSPPLTNIRQIPAILEENRAFERLEQQQIALEGCCRSEAKEGLRALVRVKPTQAV